MYESMIRRHKTVEILDNFNKSGEQYFKLTDNFTFSYKDIYYVVSFVIGKRYYYNEIIKSNINMSDFKKIYKGIHLKDITEYTKCINHSNLTNSNFKNIPNISLPCFGFICYFQNVFIDNIPYVKSLENIIKFPTPIAINAQSSDNREYDGDNLYGNKTEYPLIGYIVNNIVEDKNFFYPFVY